MARSCIVTGAARGIGKAIALRLASDGYDVCINDIPANKAGAEETAQQIQKMGRKSTVFLADVSVRAEVEALVEASVAALGPLHTMVANAGIAQVKGLLELTEEDFRRMFEVNVFGVHNCYSIAAKQMIKQGKLPEGAGVYKLLATASIVAHKPFPLLSHYSASKFAVRGLNQAYAMEMAEHGITCNSFCPGIVGTNMWDLIDEKLGATTGAKVGDTIKKFSNELTALKRISVPEDVANTVHFLASRDSDFMTGQSLVIDGGIVYT